MPTAAVRLQQACIRGGPGVASGRFLVYPCPPATIEYYTTEIDDDDSCFGKFHSPEAAIRVPITIVVVC